MKIFTAILFSGLIAGIVSAGDGGSMPATSWMGNHSGISKSQQLVIKKLDGWQKLWSQVHESQEPMPAVPKIDFSTHMVVGYFLGQRSSGGYSVSIEDIKETSEEIIVIISQTSPGRGSIVSQVITSPYAIQAIPKSDKKVVFKPSAK